MAPATPMKNELTAKAESLVRSGRKPMISAAMSMSRIAIHERPIWPRTRFLATSVATTTKRQDEEIALGRRVDLASRRRLVSPTATEPDGV